MSDQVPAKPQVGGAVHLLERLLDLVLAEIDLPAVGGGSDVIGGEGFGDGNEADGGRIATGPVGRARDTIANVGQPGAERGGISHAAARAT